MRNMRLHLFLTFLTFAHIYLWILDGPFFEQKLNVKKLFSTVINLTEP